MYVCMNYRHFREKFQNHQTVPEVTKIVSANANYKELTERTILLLFVLYHLYFHIMKYIKFLFPPKIVFVWPENVTQNIDLYQRFLKQNLSI